MRGVEIINFRETKKLCLETKRKKKKKESRALMDHHTSTVIELQDYTQRNPVSKKNKKR